MIEVRQPMRIFAVVFFLSLATTAAVFRIASVTKPLTATAAMQLAKGKLRVR